jgi:hypothetical protein
MVAAIFVAVLCLGCGYAGWGYVKLARRMVLYKSARGQVVQREVVPIPSGDTRTGAFGDGGGYMPRVVYRYTVNGAELESDKLQFAVQGWKRAVAETKLAAIPDDVTVWYDPDAPSTAYLVRHHGGIGYLFMGIAIFGACCDAIGLAVHFFG